MNKISNPSRKTLREEYNYNKDKKAAHISYLYETRNSIVLVERSGNYKLFQIVSNMNCRNCYNGTQCDNSCDCDNDYYAPLGCWHKHLEECNWGHKYDLDGLLIYLQKCEEKYKKRKSFDTFVSEETEEILTEANKVITSVRKVLPYKEGMEVKKKVLKIVSTFLKNEDCYFDPYANNFKAVNENNDSLEIIQNGESYDASKSWSDWQCRNGVEYQTKKILDTNAVEIILNTAYFSNWGSNDTSATEIVINKK